MTGPARLSAEVDAFAAIVDELRAIAARSDPGRRAELIAVRRRLAERIGQLREAGLAAFADPALANAFRTRLSDAFNLMAIHQANWPAVSIAAENDAYRQSAQRCAQANRAFIDWTRAALAGLG